MNEEHVNGAKTKPVKKISPKKAKPNAIDSSAVLELRWNLHELPSSQHRAGLAGLALCVEFLKRKPDRKGTCEIKQIDDDGLTLVVDRQGMQSLFDDLYDASLEEQFLEKKRQKKKGESKVDTPPKREETRSEVDKTGKAKNVTRYVYDQVVPRGAMIDELDEGVDGKKPWLSCGVTSFGRRPTTGPVAPMRTAQTE